MKKIILTLAAVILSAGLISAQDMAQATETAQNANEALVAKDYAKALEGFKQALTLAQACGEEGEELVGTCKSVIPSIVLTIAKNVIKESKYDEGVAQLEEAIKVAEEYGNDEVIGKTPVSGTVTVSVVVDGLNTKVLCDSKELGEASVANLSTEVAGGFVGCCIGIYASANGKESDTYVTFKDLTYTAN